MSPAQIDIKFHIPQIITTHPFCIQKIKFGNMLSVWSDRQLNGPKGKSYETAPCSYV